MNNKKGEIASLLPKSPATGYVDMWLDKVVRIEIIADTPDFIPKYKTKGATCCDLVANLETESIVLLPGVPVLVDCGFKIALPIGYEGQIRARSGLATKGIIVINATEEQEGGTLDFDFRGRIKVILINVSHCNVTVVHRERIAQMSVRPVWICEFESVDAFEEYDGFDRKEGGFGSTGTK